MNRPNQVIIITQINIHGIRNKRAAIQHHLNELAPVILELTEPWLDPRTTINFYNYNIIRFDRETTEDLGGGVAFIIRKNHSIQGNKI